MGHAARRIVARHRVDLGGYFAQMVGDTVRARDHDWVTPALRQPHDRDELFRHGAFAAISVQRIEERFVAKTARIEILWRCCDGRAFRIGQAKLIQHRRVAQKRGERLVRVDRTGVQARAVAKDDRVRVDAGDPVRVGRGQCVQPRVAGMGRAGEQQRGERAISQQAS